MGPLIEPGWTRTCNALSFEERIPVVAGGLRTANPARTTAAAGAGRYARPWCIKALTASPSLPGSVWISGGRTVLVQAMSAALFHTPARREREKSSHLLRPHASQLECGMADCPDPQRLPALLLSMGPQRLSTGSGFETP